MKRHDARSCFHFSTPWPHFVSGINLDYTHTSANLPQTWKGFGPLPQSPGEPTINRIVTLLFGDTMSDADVVGL